jgi:hypothetical protein
MMSLWFLDVKVDERLLFLVPPIGYFDHLCDIQLAYDGASSKRSFTELRETSFWSWNLRWKKTSLL